MYQTLRTLSSAIGHDQHEERDQEIERLHRLVRDFELEERNRRQRRNQDNRERRDADVGIVMMESPAESALTKGGTILGNHADKGLGLTPEDHIDAETVPA